MSKQPRAYEALAVHLAPDDPGEGERQIDAAILTLQRARYRPLNRSRALFWLGQFLLGLSTLLLGARFLCWFEPQLWQTFFGVLAGAVPTAVAKVLFVGAFLHFVYHCTFGAVTNYGPIPTPPEPIYEWLAAHGKSNLTYWHEIYWSYRKLEANRKALLGFVIWRKTPCPPDRYPPAPALVQAAPTPENPHLVYLDSPQGCADREAFMVTFEHRMHDWWRLSFKLTLAGLIMLLIVIYLPVYPETQAGHVIRTGVMTAFIFGCILAFFSFGIVPMRWLPYPVRHYWFRGLPPEATQFRDHVIALYRY